MKIFELSNAAEVVSEYIKHHPLSKEAITKMVDMPNSRDLVLEYISRNCS